MAFAPDFPQFWVLAGSTPSPPEFLSVFRARFDHANNLSLALLYERLFFFFSCTFFLFSLVLIQR